MSKEMNDKLLCPFCGAKLYRSDNCYVCLNDQCIFCDFHFMEKRWNAIIELKQALIQSQRDLQIAKQALVEIRDEALSVNRYRIIADANHAFAQINHDNKDKM